MKNEEVKRNADEFTGAASAAARSLAFAGIAVIWIFHESNDGTRTLPADLYLPLTLFAAVLALDWLHYMVGGLLWHGYAIYRSVENVRDARKAPRFHIALELLWLAKGACLVPAYWYLLRFLWDRLQ